MGCSENITILSIVLSTKILFREKENEAQNKTKSFNLFHDEPCVTVYPYAPIMYMPKSTWLFSLQLFFVLCLLCTIYNFYLCIWCISTQKSWGEKKKKGRSIKRDCVKKKKT